jgi:hypothetical protein
MRVQATTQNDKEETIFLGKKARFLEEATWCAMRPKAMRKTPAMRCSTTQQTTPQDQTQNLQARTCLQKETGQDQPEVPLRHSTGISTREVGSCSQKTGQEEIQGQKGCQQASEESSQTIQKATSVTPTPTEQSSTWIQTMCVQKTSQL